MAGLKWKKTKTLGIPGFKRYLHFKIYATQKGLSSYGVKVGPATWNSTKRGLRWDLWGGFYVDNRTPRNGNRRQRRGGGQGGTTDASGKTSGRARKRRGPLSALAAWLASWTARGVRWGGTQTVTRSRGYVDRVTAPGRLVADRRRAFGHAPVVVDMFTGEPQQADTVTLPDPDYADPRAVTAAGHAWHQQHLADDAARVDHAMRPQRLSFLERLQLRANGQDPDAWERTSDAIRAEVMTRRLARLAAATNPGQPAGPGTTPVVPVSAAQPGGWKEPSMANPVRNLDDLRDPAIDPHNYAEELPEHIGQAARLFAEIAEEWQDRADRLRRDAEAARAYAEYMETAEVDQTVLSELQSAADALDSAATHAQGLAEQYGTASESAAAAARSAEAIYGEHKPPRFDKAG